MAEKGEAEPGPDSYLPCPAKPRHHGRIQHTSFHCPSFPSHTHHTHHLHFLHLHWRIEQSWTGSPANTDHRPQGPAGEPPVFRVPLPYHLHPSHPPHWHCVVSPDFLYGNKPSPTADITDLPSIRIQPPAGQSIGWSHATGDSPQPTPHQWCCHWHPYVQYPAAQHTAASWQN